jgi:hypothetical protein
MSDENRGENHGNAGKKYGHKSKSAFEAEEEFGKT